MTVENMDYQAAVHQILVNDSTLAGLVDSKIETGINPMVVNDSLLEETHHTCIFIQSLSEVDKPLPGVALHGNSDHDELFRFTIVNKIVSGQPSSDVYARSVARRIKTIIKLEPSVELNGVNYVIRPISPSGITTKTITLDQFSDRVFVIGEFRIKYYG